MTTVIFDLDGTLADTSQDVMEALVYAFNENSVHYKELNKTIIGPPAIQIINNLTDVDHGTVLKVLASFRKMHDNSELTHSKLMPNAHETLDKLNSMKVRICLATNKPRSGAINLLTKFKISSYFDVISCLGDPLVESKLDSINRCVISKSEDYFMIGDSVGDVSAANACGINSVGYVGGFGNNKELISANPDYIIKDLSEIPSIIIKSY